MLWFRVPEKIYFKYGCLREALRDLQDDGRRRAFVVTDRFLYESGTLAGALQALEEQGIMYEVFADVAPDPTLECARRGLAAAAICAEDPAAVSPQMSGEAVVSKLSPAG